MRVAILGASGMIGTALCGSLTSKGGWDARPDAAAVPQGSGRPTCRRPSVLEPRLPRRRGPGPGVLVETHGCSGPYNLAAPEPVTNAEFSRVLARALGRPTLLPVPEFALRIHYGELADDVLSSWRLAPNRLRHAGFEFEHPDARSVVAAALR